MPGHYRRLVAAGHRTSGHWTPQNAYIDDFYSGNAEELKFGALIKEMYRYIDSTVHLNVNDMFTAALKATRIEMSEAEKKQFMAQHIKTMQMSIAPDGEVVLSFKHK